MDVNFKIGKQGNSAHILLRQDSLTALGVQIGDTLTGTIENGVMTLRKAGLNAVTEVMSRVQDLTGLNAHEPEDLEKILGILEQALGDEEQQPGDDPSKPKD